MSEAETEETVRAALLVIGDEILSGRTVDQNINYIALHCTKIGIRLDEVRVIKDIEDTIIDAVNHLRRTYDYVFTTGGIGPTHDDITAASVARAFDVEIHENEEAIALMAERYPGQELTEARRLMARIPLGAGLIKNTVSGAPGFRMENVIVMAGVPKIMQVMLDSVTPSLRTGRALIARSVVVEAPESRVASCLKELQSGDGDISIGSYPYFREGRVGTVVVLRSVEEGLLESKRGDLGAYLEAENIGFYDEES